MSIDQKPNMEEEKERIELAGGFVKSNRVDGSLSMSRALGDHQYKSNKSLP
jgi:serine/threonine protein phosphatase PrpC